MPTRVQLENLGGHYELRLTSEDETNRLTRACVLELLDAVRTLRRQPSPVLVTGNSKFFSAGADLTEIQALGAASALEFAKMGQKLMQALQKFPAPVFAAIDGYCMGGGLDLALACHRRIASPHAVFGHRGAALGLVTGWGGTQHLPRLVGKGGALAMFLAAEKLFAKDAWSMGLIDAVAEDPVAEAVQRMHDTARQLEERREQASARQS